MKTPAVKRPSGPPATKQSSLAKFFTAKAVPKDKTNISTASEPSLQAQEGKSGAGILREVNGEVRNRDEDGRANPGEGTPNPKRLKRLRKAGPERSKEVSSDASRLEGRLEDADVLEDALEAAGAVKIEPGSRLDKRVRLSNTQSPDPETTEMPGGAKAKSASNTGKRGRVSKSPSPEIKDTELDIAAKGETLGKKGKRGRPSKSRSPEPKAAELADAATVIPASTTGKRGRASSSQSPEPEAAEGAGADDVKSLSSAAKRGSLPKKQSPKPKLTEPTNSSKRKTASATGKRTRVSKSQSPQSGVHLMDGDSVSAPSASSVDDPIDDSEDDGSGPREAAPVGGPATKRRSGSPVKKKTKASTGKASNGKASSTLSKKEVKKKQLAEAGADKEELMQVDAASDLDALDKDAEDAKEKKPLKKAVLKYPKPTAKVEGVGVGALAAAVGHSDFDPASLATWGSGQPVPFSFIADTFEAIGEEPKRLKILKLLVNAFRSILSSTPGDLLPVVYLCTNRVAPAHEGLELGIGDATLIKALAQATGRQESQIKTELAKEGDLGKVAAAARATQRTMFKPKPLTLPDVFKTFKEIALAEGNKSQEVKKRLITKLLVSSTANEPGYIMRALQGKLRIGLAEQTVLQALGHAVVLQQDGADNKDGGLAGRMETGAQLVKQAYSECPSYDKLIPALLQHPLSELSKHVHFMPGVPVKPMLAKPTTGITEVLDKVQDTEFTVEYKYDGERAQIHIMEGGQVAIYSRNSENNTNKYPDITATISHLLKPGVSSIVLDCEAVAYDRETKKVLPFQVLSTRKRTDVKLEDITVQVCLFAFDCLYLNGKALLQQPLTERREALYSSVEEKEGHLKFAVAKTSKDPEELESFLNEAVAAGTEGLIVKTLDSTYEPSKRSAHWLKLKKDYLEGVGDTFDVVPIGAWFGRGKRTGVYGAYLLAVYNEETEEFQTISKIGTGFSEKALEELADALRQHIIDGPRPYYRYGETLLPDIWFSPAVVWEVKAADLSVSPVHKAALGLVDANKGISIRFPRLVRVRDDKAPEDATGAEQVAEMYRRQALAQSNNKASAADEDY